jgi:hypothetical protein
MSVILGVLSLSIFPTEGGLLLDSLTLVIHYYAIFIAVEIAVLWMFILLVLPEWKFLSSKPGTGIFTAFLALGSAAFVFIYFYGYFYGYFSESAWLF